MLTSVFRYPMPLLLWNWSAYRKNLLLYETLQHLWKQFNLVYAQCNISPGVIQNSLQTRLSSSLGVGLSLAIGDCSINCCQGNGTHSSTLAWKIPWTKEPGGLQSMGDDWATSLSLFTFMHWRRKWQPTPVFLPGESQGQGSLVGCHLWGCTELDTTEAT